MWHEGQFADTASNTVYKWWAKVFDEPSDFGINDGRISKLTIRENGKTQDLYNYDRGLDVAPANAEVEKVVEALLLKFAVDGAVDDASSVSCLNGKLSVGDTVISHPDEDYGCLVGEVTYIDKLGTPEHDTDNEDDDVHVDFTGSNYPPERIKEIERQCAALYDREVTFNELPLDDTIMAPSMLVNASGLSEDELAAAVNDVDVARRTVYGLMGLHDE
jgi:hypothetical protein